MLEKHHFPDSLNTIDALDVRALELNTANHLCPSLFIPDKRVFEVSIVTIGSGQITTVEIEDFYLNEIHKLNTDKYFVITGWRPSWEPFKRLIRISDELLNWTTPTCHYFASKQSALQWITYLRLSNKLPEHTNIDV